MRNHGANPYTPVDVGRRLSIRLVRVDPKTGLRAGPGDSGRTILEAFKPGTAPSDNYSAIGLTEDDGRYPQSPPPETGFIMRPGTGGFW